MEIKDIFTYSSI